ncbi:MAG: glycosyltransferase family 4 protein [Acidobacteriota bacterium]
MKILLVNYEWPPLGGGGGVGMADVARVLACRHDVHVLTSGTGDLPAVEHVQPDDLTVFRSKVWFRNARAVATIPSMLSFYPTGAWLGRRLVRSHSYDVINTWFAIPSGPTGVHVARAARVPHVLTLIGGDIYDPSKSYSPHRNPVLGQVVRRVIRKADRVAAISSDVAARAREYHRAAGDIRVIPLGVDAVTTPQICRDDLGLSPDAVYLICVGRLVRRKDHPSLLRAVQQLGRRDVHLLILGDGPERSRLEALARELGIEGHVSFLGHVDEDAKIRHLACADVFVMPSLHEGFGLVYLEGMHQGLPVIAATNSGASEFLEDSTTGFMVPPGAPGNLCEAIRRLVDDPDCRRRMGEANRKVAARFTVDRCARMYESLFQDAIAEFS